MSLTLTDKLVFFVSLALVVFVARWRQTKKNQAKLPGPPGHWLWGNVFDFPKVKPYKAFAEMSKKYDSDVIHLEAFGQHVLVCNTLQSINDIFERRSMIYADRALPPIMNATNWPQWSMAFIGYSDHWKEMRKMGNVYLKEENVVNYRSTQTARAAELLHNLVSTPKDFYKHLKTESAGTIVSVAYGYEIQPTGDSFVPLVNDAMTTLSTTLFFPGSDFLNQFNPLPFLPSWLPGWFPYKNHLERTSGLSIGTRLTPFATMKKDVAAGRAHDSVLIDLLQKFDGGSDEQLSAIRDLGASMYVGASDTTPSLICTFIMYISTHPELLKTAHEEIERVVGHDRLPDFSDRPNLPYVEAVVRETVRCALVMPLSLGHTSLRDDEYNGVFIPKGTLVASNVWAVNNDEKLYPNPSKFDPSRYIDAKGKFRNIGIKKLSEAPIWGYGRRKCPGRWMAEGSIWVTIAHLLATFDMKPADPNYVFDEIPYYEGLVYQPLPFEVKFTPRFENTVALIEEARAEYPIGS